MKYWEPPISNYHPNPVEPLPVFSTSEIGLMTLKEFLKFRNPEGTSHSEDSYESTLKDLNVDYEIRLLQSTKTQDGHFAIFQRGNNYLIKLLSPRRSDSDESEAVVGLIVDNVLYYANPNLLHRLPRGYREYQEWVDFPIQGNKRIKYLQEFWDSKTGTVGQRNLEGYPHLVQRIRIENAYFQIRSEDPLTLNQGTNIVIINEAGEIVACASNEWGATLLRVAAEYRGLGLGKILGEIWYRWNPEFPSGGFTSKGKANAIKIWEGRVRDFLAKGWYSELVKDNRLTKERLQAIMSGLSKGSSQSRLTPKTHAATEKKPLFMIEKDGEQWGPTFVIYDEAFFQEEDEKYIYAFGFFRSDDHVGTFLYTIDYERAFDKIATYIALQMAKNNKEKIYIGEGYGDLLELDGIQHLKKSGDYVRLTKDVVDLPLLRQQEILVRRKHDSYDEKYNRLLEMAHAKWGVGTS